MVQCTWDLSPESCDFCLRTEINLIPRCCEARQGARIRSGSCYIRYELYSFLNATAAADTPMAAPPSPLSNNNVPGDSPAKEGGRLVQFISIPMTNYGIFFC